MLRKISLSIFCLLMASSAIYAQNNRPEVILNGVNMVRDVQTPASGTAQIWVEADTLYVSGEFSNLQSYYFASNIHYGEKGKNGNPIYKLAPSLSDDHQSGIFDPEKNKFPLSDAMKEAFEEGNLYITIASDKYKRGEIRGQIDDY